MPERTHKRVLIVSASLRGRSNTDALAREFERGARDAGHHTEYVSLKGKKLSFCTGCFACLEKKACVFDDDARRIVDSMCRADALAFAAPVYCNQLPGQLKTLLDRTNPIYPLDYAFRDVYLLTAATDGSGRGSDGASAALRGWIDCFPRCRLAGEVRGDGLSEPGGAARAPEKLAEAYALGRRV